MVLVPAMVATALTPFLHQPHRLVVVAAVAAVGLVLLAVRQAVLATAAAV
jgi:hypothetical protein